MRLCLWRIGSAVSFVVSVAAVAATTVQRRAAAVDRAQAAADRQAIEAYHAKLQPTDSALVADLDHFAGKIEWSGSERTGYVVTGFCNWYTAKGFRSARAAMRVARELEHDVKVPETCDE